MQEHRRFARQTEINHGRRIPWRCYQAISPIRNGTATTEIDIGASGQRLVFDEVISQVALAAINALSANLARKSGSINSINLLNHRVALLQGSIYVSVTMRKKVLGEAGLEK